VLVLLPSGSAVPQVSGGYGSNIVTGLSTGTVFDGGVGDGPNVLFQLYEKSEKT